MIFRVAIKRIDDVFRTKIDAKRALREIVILRHCHHPNICGLELVSTLNLLSRGLIVPPDQFTYKSLWMVQVYFDRFFTESLGIRRLGPLPPSPQLQAHLELGRSAHSFDHVSAALRSSVPPSSPPSSLS